MGVVAKAALAHEQELRAADLARVEAQSELATARAHLATAKAEVALTGTVSQFYTREHVAGGVNAAIPSPDAVVKLPPRPRHTRGAASQPTLPGRRSIVPEEKVDS